MDYSMDLRELKLVGPLINHFERTCVMGQTCGIANILGTYLSNGDRVMVTNSRNALDFDINWSRETQCTRQSW